MTGSEILEMRNEVEQLRQIVNIHSEILQKLNTISVNDQTIFLKLVMMFNNLDDRLKRLEEKNAEGREDRS